jgi:hypothetical protein
MNNCRDYFDDSEKSKSKIYATLILLVTPPFLIGDRPTV